MSVSLGDGLRLEKQGNVAIITLDRPSLGNALDVETTRSLLHAAIACDQDQGVRAVLLRAEGKLFCAGGDIGAFAAADAQIGRLMLEETAYLHGAISRFMHMQKPIVTAIQGFAAGAGFSLAMLGDIVLAGRSAQFTLAYTAIGLTPDGGASWLLPKLVGLRKAQEMILLNPRMLAQEALDLGLVTRVVDDADLDRDAFDVAKQLASGPTRAFGRVKSLLAKSEETSLEAHLEIEARFIASSASEADGVEGVSAFLGKRTAVFKGQPEGISGVPKIQ